VGDDDQNIYRFRGANVDFIRRFHRDYGAEIHYLVENYRSSGHIIAAANALIAGNADRMKTDHPILINRARQSLPAGGNWHSLDPSLGRGRVQVLEAADPEQQALILVAELQRLQRLSDHWDLNRCAVLARNWRELDAVRSACNAAGIPVCLNWSRGIFPGLHRIRESAQLLEQLRARRAEMFDGRSLLTLLPGEPINDTLWSANLRHLLAAWIEETGGLPQPAHRIEDFIYESLVEQKRARSLGDGLALTTVHGAKGLEFDHVFVLGNGWRAANGAEMEEERRLYYVAMSRTRETLQLFIVKGHAHPHAALLSGDFLTRRSPVLAAGPPVVFASYALLGIKDLFIDFAGLKSEQSPERRALDRLRTGDRLRLRAAGKQVLLLSSEGIKVGRLSKAAADRWRDRLHRITEARVVALVRRDKNDGNDAAFQTRCQGEGWEFPMVELRWLAETGGKAA
jgi:ATP-dependent DNA helicase RecQ